MKRYRLGHDLPNLKAGAILTLNDGVYEIEKDDMGYYFFLQKTLVETKPYWFTEIKEEEPIKIMTGDTWLRIIGKGRDIQFTKEEALIGLSAYYDNADKKVWSDNDMIEFGWYAASIHHRFMRAGNESGIFDSWIKAKNNKSCK